MHTPPATRSIRVQPGGARSQPAAYDVIIGPGALDRVCPFIARTFNAGASVLIVQDAGVPMKHAQKMAAALHRSGFAATVSAWTPDEASKSLEGAARILDILAREHFDRRGVVVALGGGVTGDVAGFAAAIYQRGIAWVNCPCTLLAMVDSAVGGKTGVNLVLRDSPGSMLKNMIGSVHQPSLVVADIDTLESLPDRAFRSGLAECIKHAMIAADWGDPGLMDWTTANRRAFLSRDPGSLCELVARSVSLKAAVVAADEHEVADAPGGGRMSLNFGHTFGHAIETLPGLSWSGPEAHTSLQHGEAVALGLIAAARCAETMGLAPGSIADEAISVIRDFGLPTCVRGLPDDATLLERMTHDKKSRAGVLRLVLPVARGRVRIVADPPAAAVRAGINAIRG